MGQFSAQFWEIPTSKAFLENVAAEKALWFETDEDRRRRYAFEEFYKSVMPAVEQLIEAKLTPRQREVLRLYYFSNMTQEAIAASLRVAQSTVSRHLFGTNRKGKKVGGAIPKLRKLVDRSNNGSISKALDSLRSRLIEAV